MSVNSNLKVKVIVSSKGDLNLLDAVIKHLDVGEIAVELRGGESNLVFQPAQADDSPAGAFRYARVHGL
jgi:hypothetical protein